MDFDSIRMAADVCEALGVLPITVSPRRYNLLAGAHIHIEDFVRVAGSPAAIDMGLEPEPYFRDCLRGSICVNGVDVHAMGSRDEWDRALNAAKAVA